jgi:hypothetical protein
MINSLTFLLHSPTFSKFLANRKQNAQLFYRNIRKKKELYRIKKDYSTLMDEKTFLFVVFFQFFGS